jgi:hypothetical protein
MVGMRRIIAEPRRKGGETCHRRSNVVPAGQLLAGSPLIIVPHWPRQNPPALKRSGCTTS